jgi:hypothetical protein
MPALEAPLLSHSFDCDEAASVQPVATGWSWEQVWRRHRYILPSFLISLVVCTWFVTWGDWKFFEPEDFCSFYDAQARSLIHGHLDVPRAAIGSEAFTFQGKTYGYFGIGPALLRIPLVVLFQKMDGLWSRLMMMIACTISLICTYCIIRMVRAAPAVNRRTERVLHSLFILCAGIGSTTVFLVGRSFTYHEAIMWGGAFALLFTCTILKYLARPRPSLLVLAGLFAFMSFHCRPTAGAGALLAMCVLTAILAWRAATKSQAAHSLLACGMMARPFRHALIAAVAVFITLGTYFGVNYAKFRTFSSVPLQYYDFYAEFPLRMRLAGGKQIHLENIPTGMATYFGLHGMRLDDKFPWFYLADEATIVGSPAIDLIDEFSTFPISMPALTLLALIGCAPLVLGSEDMIRCARLPAVALLIGGGIVLASVGITERYLHDLYPALIIFSTAGVCRIASTKRPLGITALIVVLSAISITLNCSFALVHQREDFGAPPAKLAEFEDFQESINLLLHGPTRSPQ